MSELGDVEAKAQQIKELWNLYNNSGAAEVGTSQDGKPPFVIFNPPMYSEEYIEKMKQLELKKAKKLRKTQKRVAKNVKSSFQTEDNGNYDLESVLERLGETKAVPEQKKMIKK